VTYRNYICQLPTQAPLLTLLHAILDRPNTYSVESGKLVTISDRRFHEAGAFAKRKSDGSLELMITDVVRRKYLGHWSVLKDSPEFRALNRRDPDHETKKRCVRKGVSDRLYCFVIPANRPVIA
jgi:hypothetical protein